MHLKREIYIQILFEEKRNLDREGKGAEKLVVAIAKTKENSGGGEKMVKTWGRNRT